MRFAIGEKKSQRETKSQVWEIVRCAAKLAKRAKALIDFSIITSMLEFKREWWFKVNNSTTTKYKQKQKQ